MDIICERSRLYNQGKSAVDAIVEQIVKYSTADEQEGMLKEIRSIATEYESLQSEWVVATNALHTVKEKIDAMDGNDSPVNVFQMYEEEYQQSEESTSKKRMSHTKKFEKEFDDKLNSLMRANSSRDDDIIVTQSTVNLIDPISQLIMKNPVKNTYCNHTYDLDTITGYINSKRNKPVMCPYSGCGNSQPLSTADLIPDRLTMRHIQKASSQQ